MSHSYTEEENPFDDIFNILEGEEAKKTAKWFFPNASWISKAEMLEIFKDGSVIVNGDPFAKMDIHLLKFERYFGKFKMRT